MRTENQFKAKCLDVTMAGLEAVLGRRLLNRLGGFVYWRTRGENLDDPERNGEYRTLDTIMGRLLGSRPVALDVGANIGDWAERFVRTTDGGRVFAFEPVSDTFRAISTRFAAEPRVECVNAAVSDQPGRCEIRVGGALSGSNSIYAMPGEACLRVETITAVSGDAFVAERNLRTIDFLKIDVEGHEVGVLRGFRRAIAERRIRFIQWEYNKTWIPAHVSLRDVFELLGAAGYRLCKLRPRGLLWYAHYDRTLDNFCYSNWIAVAEADFAALRAQVRVADDTAGDW